MAEKILIALFPDFQNDIPWAIIAAEKPTYSPDSHGAYDKIN
jgi:hypothetical protein